MSLYSEYKSCCNKKDNRKVESDQKCFCGKGIRPFIGRRAIITVQSAPTGNLPTGVISCFDEKTGLVTLVVGPNDVHYVCCSKITAITLTIGD